jgi:hypothetical protein
LRLGRIYKVSYKCLPDTMRFMKSTTTADNLSTKSINRFFSKKQHNIRALLFAAFIFVTFHTLIHNKLDHIHDSDCPVYVLEQLYFSADVVSIVAVFTVFLPFLFLSFQLHTYRFEVQKYFCIRAPPLF